MTAHVIGGFSRARLQTYADATLAQGLRLSGRHVGQRLASISAMHARWRWLLGVVVVAACAREGEAIYREVEYLHDDVFGAVPADADRIPNWPAVIYWHGPAERKAIALTFDDGPSPYTSELLAVLKAHDVKATFFMVGERVEQRPDDARAVVAAGHVVGNHTYDHPYLVRLGDADVASELGRAQAAIARATGVRPRLYRPPYGSEDLLTLQASLRLGYIAVEWCDSSKDWLRPGVDQIVARVLKDAHAGAIILMHDGGGDRSQTIAAVARLIPILQSRGFELVTVPELLGVAAYRDPPAHAVLRSP